MIVSLEEFQKYTGVYGSDDDQSASLYISASQDILVSYLGYEPEKQRYIKMLSGMACRRFVLEQSRLSASKA